MDSLCSQHGQVTWPATFWSRQLPYCQGKPLSDNQLALAVASTAQASQGMAPTLGHVAALPINLPMVWTWGVGVGARARVVGVGAGTAMAHVGVCSTGSQA